MKRTVRISSNDCEYYNHLFIDCQTFEVKNGRQFVVDNVVVMVDEYIVAVFDGYSWNDNDKIWDLSGLDPKGEDGGER